MKKRFVFLLLLTPGFVKAQTELVDFESAPLNVTIDSITGCWQIGTPSKTIFDSAYSSSHALMTDTLNAYPDGTVSYAYFTFPTGNLSSGYTLSFYHRYNTESGVDGGYLEIFDCGSSSWVNFYTASAYACAYSLNYNTGNPFMSLFNGEVGFGGSNTGWDYTAITFGCNLVAQGEENRGGMPNTQFRFVFVSDANSTGHEGWIIDNLFWDDYGGFCSGIEEKQAGISMDIFPTSTSGKLNFESTSVTFSKISVYDTGGKLLDNFSFSPTHFQTLELSKLANGLYFYTVDDGRAKGKFIIEK